MALSYQLVSEVHLCCMRLSNKWIHGVAKMDVPKASIDMLNMRNIGLLHASVDRRGSFDPDRHQ
jgi:hypothetical protein